MWHRILHKSTKYHLVVYEVHKWSMVGVILFAYYDMQPPLITFDQWQAYYWLTSIVSLSLIKVYWHTTITPITSMNKISSRKYFCWSIRWRQPQFTASNNIWAMFRHKIVKRNLLHAVIFWQLITAIVRSQLDSWLLEHNKSLKTGNYQCWKVDSVGPVLLHYGTVLYNIN